MKEEIKDETFKLAGTQNTPNVFFNINKGILIIAGKSFPEHPQPLYESISDLFAEVKSESLSIRVELDYINTSSSKCLLTLLKKAKETIKKVSVIWVSEEDDDDIKETGEYFEEFTELPFEFREFVG